MVDFGVMFRCQKPPEELVEYARLIDNSGFDELWIVEDCFFAGGLTSVSIALANTNRVKVGLGIMPAVSRNPAFTAMEFANLARQFPGRFLPGIGHGIAEWMEQIGALPQSQLAALEETTQAVRLLLAGETVTMQGKHVQLDDVQLVFPPKNVPPVQLGVHGPKSLKISGRSADGTIFGEGSSPEFITWAKLHIDIGRKEAEWDDHHRLTAYVWTSIGNDRTAARVILRPTLASTLPYIYQKLEPLGIVDKVKELTEHEAKQHFISSIPDKWFDMLTVSGTIEDARTSVKRFINAGVDSIVFVIPAENEEQQIQLLAKELLPYFNHE